MPTPVRTLVFDLGGVLLDWRREYLYEGLITDPVRRRRFLDEVCDLDWNLAQDRGRSFAEGVAERIARFPEWAPEIRAYAERWDEMIAGTLPGMAELVEELGARGIPLYALTNFSRETYPRMPLRFPCFRHFRGVVVSGAEGLVKPDPALYRRLETRFGLEAGELLFIDDMPANVETALALGWRAHRFLGEADLRGRLRAEGLLP